MVDKWAGSIEIGVTTHNPTYLQLPSTMTNLRSGQGPGAPSSPLLEQVASFLRERPGPLTAPKVAHQGWQMCPAVGSFLG